MPIDDIPVGQDSLSTPVDPDLPIDAPLPSIAKVAPQSSRNTLVMQTAVITNSKDEVKPLFQAFQEISDTAVNPQRDLSIAAVKSVQEEKQDYLTTFKANPGDTPEDAADNLAAVGEISQQLDIDAADEDLVFVRNASKGRLDSETEQRLAVQLKITKMMKKSWDDMGKGDVALDVLGMVVPGNIMKDNYDLSGNIFSAEEYMRNFVLNFKQLTPAKQLELLPTVQDVLKADLNNNLKVMSVLDKLVSPVGEEDLGDFGAIWGTLDVLDVASLGTLTMLKVARMTKALNAPKILEAAGDIEDAADVAAGVIVDGSATVASGANVDRTTTAVNNATGVNMKAIDPAQAGTMSAETMNRIDKFSDQVKGSVDEVSGQELFLRESLLQKEERTAAEVATVSELKSKMGVEDITITSRSDTSTVFEYKLQGEDTITTHKMDLTLDDVGQYTQSSVGLISRFLASPAAWAKGNLKQDVDAAMRADSAQAVVFNQLVDLNRESVKSILGPLGLKGITPSGRKKLAELDHVLRTGDAETKVYTPLELQAGVDGVKLNDKQQEAYYKTRSLVDSLLELRNRAKRQELVLQGMRDVRMNGVDETGEAIEGGVSQIGRDYKDATGAAGALNTSKPRILWDEASGATVSRESLDLPALYTMGKRVVRFQSPIQPGQAEGLINFAIVSADAVTDLPAMVLRKRVGYVPKINQGVSYFVKQFKATRVDGADVSAGSAGAKVDTIRFFDNKAEAETWLEGYKKDNPGEYRVLEDRQLEQESRAGNLDGEGGGTGGAGLYNGPRSSKEILFGTDGTTVDRLGAFEAIGRNMSNVARYVPRNAWRMGMEQRAINTANQLVPGAKFTSFSDLAGAPGTEAGDFVRKLHSQIEDWMGFPSKEEQLWGAMVQGTYEKVAGIKGMKNILWAKDKDPFALARTAAFHSLLGWFNPIQLWVQAQGAAVAMSTNLFNPVALANSIRLTSALAATDNITNPAAIANAGKAFGMKKGEMERLKRLWNQTGLKDSILTNADHAAAVEGRGVAMDSLGRTANMGLVIYRAGELFNRRISFTTALKQFEKANPGVEVGPEQLKEVLTRANNTMLGLTKANRARWQVGALGVPLQFVQVTSKTVETLLGLNGNFTAVERGKILTAQILLYGGAGVPLGGMGATWLIQSMGYTSQADIENDLSPEVRKLANEGFQGWASMAMFGIDIDVGQRASLASGINQTLDRFIFDDKTLAEQFLGAFGSSSTRFWRGMTDAFEPLSGGLAEARIITDPQAAVSGIAKTLSTWNNVSKALFMNSYNRINDKNGNPLVARKFSLAEEVAVAIGFRLKDEVQVYELKDIVKAKQQLNRDITSTIVRIHWDYSLKAQNDELTPAYKEAVRERIALMYQSIDTNFSRKQVRDAVKKRLAEGGDENSRQWRKIRKLWNDGQVDLLLKWKDKLTTRGILQQAGPTIEETE